MSKHSDGGKARASKLTAAERSAIARGAALKRWGRDGDRVATPPPYDGISHIYGLGPERGPLKIGYSSAVYARRGELQCGNHQVLILHFAVEVPDITNGPSLVERKVHHLLREHRIRGEWFDIPPELAELAAQNAVAEVLAGHLAPEHEEGATSLIYFEPEMLARVRAYAKNRSQKIADAIISLINLGLVSNTPKAANPASGAAKSDGPVIIRPKPGALLDKKAKRWRV